MSEKQKTVDAGVDTGEPEKAEPDNGAQEGGADAEKESDEPELSEADQDVAMLVEQFGSSAAAAEAMTEHRAKEAKEAGCHTSELPEDREQFVLRRKLETAAANERKRAADVGAVQQRRKAREVTLKRHKTQSIRNHKAGVVMRKARAASQLRSPTPTHGGKGEEEYTERVLAEAAEAQAERDGAVAQAKSEHDRQVQDEREEQAAADSSEPNVVTNKVAIPKNLDGLNLNALRALAKAHDLTVERADGTAGEARKADYVAALSV